MITHKSILLVVAMALLCSLSICAQQYKPVDNASEVKFTVENLGIDINGSLAGPTGTIVFNPSNLKDASFTVSIDVNSVRTGIETLDNHLKKRKDFFDVAKYPTMRFVSTAISKTEKEYKVTGLLTIKDVTKTVTFPFTTRLQNNGVVFNANFRIKRKDFHLGGGITVSENVDVSLKVPAMEF